MSPEAAFAAALLVTVALLASVVVTGLRARRRLHLSLVACSFVSLGVTIWLAERMGHYYDLEAAGSIYHVHLALAKIATLSYLLPLATGIATLRRPARRPLHRAAAFLTLGLTLAAFGTGTWMILASEPLAPSAAAREVADDPRQAQ